MTTNKILLLSVAFFFLLLNTLYAQCNFELINVKEKKCKILIDLRNVANKSTTIHSNSISYSKGVFIPLYYSIKDDTLFITLNDSKSKLFNLGHRIYDSIEIDGELKSFNLNLEIDEIINFKIEKEKKDQISFIRLIISEDCILEQNI